MQAHAHITCAYNLLKIGIFSLLNYFWQSCAAPYVKQEFCLVCIIIRTSIIVFTTKIKKTQHIKTFNTNPSIVCIISKSCKET